MTAHVVVIYKASNVQFLYIRKDLKLNGCFYSRNRDEIHVRAVDNWGGCHSPQERKRRLVNPNKICYHCKTHEFRYMICMFAE